MQLPTWSAQPVAYPNRSGVLPNPGSAAGRNYDQGVAGVRTDGRNLIVRLATGLDPLTGYYNSRYNVYSGQGDMFLSVSDSSGIRHFALLNTWPRNGIGIPRPLNDTRFDLARTFHVAGGAGGSGLEGHLVGLGLDRDVTLAGGIRAYNSRNAPLGLDLRVFASGGTDLGYAGLSHDQLFDYGQTWYVQTWTFRLDALSPDASFQVAFHSAPSSGNDQIGGIALVTSPVPAPGAAALGLIGLGMLPRLRRRLE